MNLTFHFFFAGPKGNTISKIEKYCLKICGHARKIKRESGVSRSDLNDERGNGSYGQFHGPDPESWARWKLKFLQPYGMVEISANAPSPIPLSIATHARPKKGRHRNRHGQHHHCRRAVVDPHADKCRRRHEPSQNTTGLRPGPPHNPISHPLMQSPPLQTESKHKATKKKIDHRIGERRRCILERRHIKQWKQNERKQGRHRNRNRLRHPKKRHHPDHPRRSPSRHTQPLRWLHQQHRQ